MAAKKVFELYVVIAPTGKAKTYSVASRRVGAGDRYTVIATCQSEVMADSIVKGLHSLQGTLDKLDAKNEPLIADLRRQFTREREEVSKQHGLHLKYHGEVRELQDKLHTKEREFDTYKAKTQNEYNKLRAELNGLRHAKGPVA